ncbi:MAG: hypothetical protein AAF911_07590 [Planctomycetota bacterium]
MKPGVILLLLACVLPGCVTTAPPLPTVEWDTLEDARQILIDRQNAIESVQAQLKLKITTPPPESETNTLDAALVMQGDDRFRLRAWKLNQTIFDLTATPDGTFIVANEEMKKRAPEAEHDLAELADQLNGLLRGPNFSDAQLFRIEPAERFPLDFRDYGLYAEWERSSARIDANTLAPYEFYLSSAQTNQAVVLNPEYSEYTNGIWYRTVTATGDFGTVEMTFRDVELNGELNPRAFRPPRRAVRVEVLAASSAAEQDSP